MSGHTGGGESGGDTVFGSVGEDPEGHDHEESEWHEASNASDLRPRPWLPLAGLAVGAWSLVPPYAGPALNTRFRVEIVDHVVPGVVVLLASLAALVATRRTRRPLLMLTTGFVVLLAGFWMSATHIPLVDEGTRGEVGLGAVVHHSAPGLALTLVGLLWAITYWAETGPPDNPVTAPSGEAGPGEEAQLVAKDAQEPE